MVTSHDRGAKPESRGYSRADDIVELIVLSRDEGLLRTLRQAVGASRRLWHVTSPSQVGDLLVAGEVGILLIDVKALDETATSFVSGITRLFPDLVIIVAGERAAGQSLGGFISKGVVHRFMHKPVSPARARSFVEAAVRKYGEGRARLSTPRSARASEDRRRRFILCAALLLAAGGVGTWALHRRLAARTPPHAAELRASAADS